jgi:hypothetical protein
MLEKLVRIQIEALRRGVSILTHIFIVECALISIIIPMRKNNAHKEHIAKINPQASPAPTHGSRSGRQHR